MSSLLHCYRLAQRHVTHIAESTEVNVKMASIPGSNTLTRRKDNDNNKIGYFLLLCLQIAHSPVNKKTKYGVNTE